MRSSDEQIYAALLREDFYTFMLKVFQTLKPGTTFKANWHLRVVAAELERVARGEQRRLILNLPPRSLKSIAASVALVAWYLGHHPEREVICASYGQDLASKFAQDCRKIMQAPWYQLIFSTRLSRSKSAVDDFRTIQGGGRFATSVGGPTTGRGASLIVIDDPAKPEEMLSETQREAVTRWFNSTVYSRMDDKEADSIVVAMQRLHVLDLTGFLEQAGGWKLLKLSAIADKDETFTVTLPTGRVRTFHRKEGEVLHPLRESKATLDDIRTALGSYLFSAQYLQTPMMPDGNIVKISWFARYDEAPSDGTTLQSWDTASKTGELNSYSVCTTWRLKGKKAYLIDVYRKRLEYPDLKRAVIEQATKHRPSVILVEEKSSGAALIQDLRRENIHTLKAIKPEGSKEMRMSAQTAYIENGFVHLPNAAPWLQAYEQELMLFPIGAHNDQVDSTSQALAYVQTRLAEPGMIAYYRMDLEERGLIPKRED